MLKLLSHFALLFSTDTTAPADTIPPCISFVRTETGKLLSKYEYKGQYWFAFQPALKVEDNNSDKMTTITFYDSTCHVIARWTKGGIAGLNKVIPDSVDKKKIIPLWAEKDTVAKQTSGYKKNMLPDTIQKIAIQKKATWIQQSDLAGILFFNFQFISKPNTGSAITFESIYYDESGKLQSKVPAGKVSWWHHSTTKPVKFTHTQFKPGYR